MVTGGRRHNYLVFQRIFTNKSSTIVSYEFQSGVELELVECQPLLEWLANNYKSFGATLEIITDKSQEGSQFVRGFGGIGGMYIVIFTLNNDIFCFNRDLGI